MLIATNGPRITFSRGGETGALERIMSEPHRIAINAKFGDDFLMHVVVITSADTMAEVAQKVARHSVGKRISPQPRDMVVYYEGRAVAAHTTVTEAGIRPLQHVFVDYVLSSREGD
jgi:toluene monooxygenase system protein B